MEGTGATGSIENCKNLETLNFTESVRVISDINIGIRKLIYILYTNADSLNNKKHELVSLISSLSNKPSVIVITEVNSKIGCTGMQDNEFSINRYKTFSKNIGVNKKRGIIIYVDNSLNSCECEIDSAFSEYLLLRIFDQEKNCFYIAALYRSPNSDDANNSLLTHVIDMIKEFCLSQMFIIIGDFNLTGIDWSKGGTIVGKMDKSSLVHSFINCIQSNFLQQNVTQPTRYRGTNNPSILDLALTNEDLMSDIDYLSPLGKSDHCCLLLSCEVFLKEKIFVPKLNFKKGDYINLNSFILDSLSKILIDPSLLSIDDLWTEFVSIIREGTLQYIPFFKVNGNKTKGHIILPSNLRQMIKRKHRSWTRYLETKNVNYYNEYKM